MSTYKFLCDTISALSGIKYLLETKEITLKASTPKIQAILDSTDALNSEVQTLIALAISSRTFAARIDALGKAIKILEKEALALKAERVAARAEANKQKLAEVYAAVAGTRFEQAVNDGAKKAVDSRPHNILFAIELETGMSIEKLIATCDEELKERLAAKEAAAVPAVEEDKPTQDRTLTSAEKEHIKDYLASHGRITGCYFIKHLNERMVNSDDELTAFALEVFAFVNKVKREENTQQLKEIDRKLALSMAEAQRQQKKANQAIKRDANVKRAQAIGEIKYTLEDGHLIATLKRSTVSNATRFIRRYMKSLGIAALGKTLDDHSIKFGIDATQEIIEVLEAKAKPDHVTAIQSAIEHDAAIKPVKVGKGSNNFSTQDAILKALDCDEWISMRSLVEQTGKIRQSVSRACLKLVATGILTSKDVQEGGGKPMKYYKLTHK